MTESFPDLVAAILMDEPPVSLTTRQKRGYHEMGKLKHGTVRYGNRTNPILANYGSRLHPNSELTG
jgi:hypothetical protein